MRRLLAVLLAAAALTGGCGSDDQTAAPEATATPTPASDDSRGGPYSY